MTWIRIDTDLEMDRRFIQLDGFSRALWLFILRLAKKDEGSISVADWESGYLSKMLDFADRDEEIKAGMDKILELEMAIHEGDRITIPTWGKYQSTAAERMRKSRDTKKANDNHKPVTHKASQGVTECNERNSDTPNIHTYRHTNIQTDRESEARTPEDIDKDKGEDSTSCQPVMGLSEANITTRAFQILLTIEEENLPMNKMVALENAVRLDKEFPRTNVLGVIREAAGVWVCNGKPDTRWGSHLRNWCLNEKKAVLRGEKSKNFGYASGRDEPLWDNPKSLPKKRERVQ